MISFGIIVILLGLAAAGVLADVAVENVAAPTDTVVLFGQALHPSNVQLAVAGAVVGAAAVLLVGLGAGLLRASRKRRQPPAPDHWILERRVEQVAARARLLESQNASLTQENMALRYRAEEVEGGPLLRPAEEFGHPSRQVSKTALILVPPPPASPADQASN